MTDTTELIERAHTAARILMDYEAWEMPAQPPADPMDYAWTAQVVDDLRDALSASYRQGLEDERKRAIAAIHWVFSADGTKTERSMADEAINKINDPTFMPRALKDNPNG